MTGMTGIQTKQVRMTGITTWLKKKEQVKMTRIQTKQINLYSIHTKIINV